MTRFAPASSGGMWGRNRVPSRVSVQDVDRVAVCDHPAAFREEPARAYPGIREAGSVQALQQQADAVVVASAAGPTAAPGAEFGQFVKVARGGVPTRADVSDGVRVVRVLEARSRSISTGGGPAPVEV